MRRAVALLVVALGLAFCVPARAQQPGPQCVAASQLRVDTVETVIAIDLDGDRWSKLRVRSTGAVLIGFWKLSAGQFCVVASAQENPET